MDREDRKRWEVLCEQATTEADPTKLMELIREINDDLEERELDLTRRRSGVPSTAAVDSAEA
jgi:hypothetical protein